MTKVTLMDPAPARIVDLVGKAMNAKIELDRAEEAFKARKAILEDMLRNVLPEAMDEAGLAACALPNGDVIKVEDVTRASITEEHREAALDYLRANGFEHMIKGQMIIQFGLKDYTLYQSFRRMVERVFPDVPMKVVWEGDPVTSDREVVKSLENLIRKACEGRKVTAKETVPGSTLLAFVRKQLDTGTEFPADVFSAVRVREAKIPGLKPAPDATAELLD